jgi:hypothetical protein
LDQRRDAALTAWYAMANEGTGINDARALVLGELADLRAGRDSPERTRVRWL